VGAGQQWLFKKGPPELVQKVLFHTVQAQTATYIEKLTDRLRKLDAAEACFALQEELLSTLYQAEKIEHEATKQLAMAPDDLDVRAQQFAAGRATRQLRVVGDGLAWLVTGGHRAAIAALSQNESSGRIFGEGKGLDAEVSAVNAYWKQGHFALLHDLTNCLRIDDVTVVNRLHRADVPDHQCPADAFAIAQVKANRKKKLTAPQKRRRRLALDAINHGGPLIGPGGLASQQFRTKVPYETHEAKLAEILRRAMEDGVAGGALEDGWAISALRWVNWPKGTNMDEIVRAWEIADDTALKEAGVRERVWRIHSGDAAGRMLKCIPFSIYDLEPKATAWLTCDWLVYYSTISVDSLAAKLRERGMVTRVSSGVPTVLTGTRGDHSIQVSRTAFEHALLELIKLDVMADAFHEWLEQPGFTGSGELVFA
jgi:hypothetical protein